jgi:two-component system chemotaxis response regulator CheB
MEHKRDIVVVGCSAGGVEALPRLLAPLPPTFPASICIVQHMGVSENPYLVNILKRSSMMPVSWAEQGARMLKSNVYVAPPDTHLMFSDDHLALSQGPRENHARPSIDKLFRSAAVEHRSRVIGVLLTGMMDDGVAGLKSIAETGGLTIVQDPDDAAFPELPSRALLALSPDRVLPLLGISAALNSLIGDRVEHAPVAAKLELEARLDRPQQASPAEMTELGPQTPVSCPDCKGPTWLIGDEHSRRYRCYLGHVNSARQLLAQESRELESALWNAVRALNDRANTLETLAEDSNRLGRAQVSQLYQERAREARTHAELAHKFLSDLVRN